MYPNTYLGAGNGLRPGQQPQQQPSPQYGGASPFGQPPQQQQQPSPFAPQPTGFGQAPLQSQYTGYPGLQPQATGMPLQAQATGMPQQMPGQLQQQYTGFPGQGLPQQTGFQTSAAPPMPAIPAQYQQQVQPPLPSLPQKTSSPFASTPSQGLAPPAAPMKPQPTGFQEMAASFQTAGGAAARASAAQSAKPHNKIPNIRLSFITAQDQTKFETLFTSAVGDGQTTMSGEKARDLLLRSRLDGDSLSHIWTLADTTRSGQLHFPEFALAMYLCNLKLTGKTLPTTLPDTVKNEVSSMVDIINFNIEDSGSNAGNPARQPTASPTIHHPQPQASNSQLLQATMTGYPGQQQQQQQQPAFLSQPTGLQPQQTGYPGMPQNPQPTGYAGPLPPMPPMPTGFNGGPNAMAAPLNAQPTGRPGQWGLVNTPSSGLPNIDILQARMMPQTGRDQGSFTTVGLQGNAQIPWAITKGEKTTYDAIFRAWDGMNKGYIAGSQAIEIFGQSGLEKPDLERIWTLADHGNKGRLNLDEFAVAMHLIYRKLNGYPVPARLPAELVPPSTRNFSESLDTLKNLVNQESDYRKNSGAALLPQKTGVSYLKNHSFRNQQGAAGANRKDGTVFKNNDEAVGYRSSARRRIGGGTDSPRPDSPSSVASNDDLTLDQLRKKVKEKQVLLDALDFKDEKNAEEDEILDRKDRREADELYRRIRRIQEDIDSHPNASQMQAGGSSDAERRTLKRQLQAYTDKIPALASQVRKTEKAIAEARLELFRIKDAKAHPSSEEPIVGTGPGGAVTESDRVKARAKAMMRQRTAALRGEKIESSDNGADAARRLEEESSKVRSEKENNERMVQDVEESVRAFAAGIEDNLKDTGDSSTSEHERRRWEDALGVEDEVRDFIFDLQRTSRSNRLRAQERRHETRGAASVDTYDGHSPSTSRMESPASSTRSPAPTAAAGGSSYSAYKTPEERAAYIKEQAAQRMQERLAAIGISRRGESAAQRAEREKSERAEKARAAEEETARRDAERQARLAEEQGIPPPVAAEAKKAAPPPPAVRKAAPAPAPAKVEEEEKEEPAADDDELATAESRLKQLEEQVRLSKLKKEEEKKKKKAAHAEAKEREAKMAARRAEIEAARKREEELRRQLEHMDDDDDDDDDSSDDDDGPQQITPQASTPTVASSQVSNDREVRPAAAAAAAPPAAPASASPGSPDDAKAESRNPYFRMMSQSSDSSAAASAAAAPAPPAAPATVVTPPTNAAPASDASTNPFHRMTVNPIAAAAPMAPMPTGPISRKRADADDDGWGSDNDDDDDDESDDDRPGGKSAAELASRLFGSMAPPRPLSAVGDKGASSSPAPVASPTVPPPVPAAEPAAAAATPMSPDSSSSSAYADAPTTAPPPPPPVPSADAPSVPPPPPPPPPPFGAPAGVPPPPPPPPPPGGAPGAPPPPPPGPPPPPTAAGGAGGRVLPAGFLGEVMTGKALKKTVTIDKSGAATAGRVLD